MKFKYLVLGLSIALFSCGGSGEADTATTEASEENVASEESGEVAAAVTYAVNTEESSIAWKGEAFLPVAHSHSGVVSLAEGSIEVSGENVVGGEFVVDMNTIQATDDEGYGETENTKEQLVGHLLSGDFFSVADFGTASYKITSAEGNTLKGDFNVKGKTNEETVVVESVSVEDAKVVVKGTLTFDRANYDALYGVKDAAIANEVPLTITLIAQAAQ